MGTISFPSGIITTDLTTGSISEPDYGTITTDYAQSLIAQALVNLDPSSIVTFGSNVTGWNNIGTGGSAYDLNVIVGTAANLTITTVNGYSAVASSGSVGLESTAVQTIASPATMLFVSRFTNPAPSTTQSIIDARSSATDRMLVGAIPNYSIFQGATLAGPAYDTVARVIIGRFAGDATSQIMISGETTVTGNAGNKSMDYGSLFTSFDGSASMEGWIQHGLIWNYLLSQSQANALMSYMRSRYGI